VALHRLAYSMAKMMDDRALVSYNVLKIEKCKIHHVVVFLKL
jgi:hypothetical protein